jgi:hypothetical protein
MMTPEDLCKYIIFNKIFDDVPIRGRDVWPERYEHLKELARAAMAGARIRYIYKYLRADGEEIDMGLYDSKGDAEAAMKNHASFGALTKGPIEVDKSYELFKG